MIFAGEAGDMGSLCLEMRDSRQISGGMVPVRMGRKVVSIGRMQSVTMHMVS